MKHNVPFFAAAILVVLIAGLQCKAIHGPYRHVNPNYVNPEQGQTNNHEAEKPLKDNIAIESIEIKDDDNVADSVEDIKSAEKEPEVNDDANPIDKGYELNIKPEQIQNIHAPQSDANVKPEESEQNTEEEPEAESKSSEELISNKGVSQNNEEADSSDKSGEPNEETEAKAASEKVENSEASDQEGDEKQEESETTEKTEEELKREANMTEAKRRLTEAYEQAMEEYGDLEDRERILSDILVKLIVLMIEGGMLDDGQVDEICDWLCANYSCPPDCPGYYEPPWG